MHWLPHVSERELNGECRIRERLGQLRKPRVVDSPLCRGIERVVAARLVDHHFLDRPVAADPETNDARSLSPLVLLPVAVDAIDDLLEVLGTTEIDDVQ
jgi:hypothetical protein